MADEKDTSSEDAKPTDSPQLTKEQWEVAFAHDRFKELQQEAKAGKEALKKLEKLEKAQAEAEAKKLEEEGKYKELLEAQKKETETLKQQIEEQTKRNAVISEAVKVGVIDPDAAWALADRTLEPTEAVKQLVEAKPYLAGKQTPPANVGAGASPQTQGDKKIWKYSEVQRLAMNAPEYEKAKDEIELAQKEGRIVKD